MSGYEKFYNARENIVDILRKDLIGPISADEVLHENPERYYIMGKLYPQRPDASEDSGSMTAEEADREADSVINQSDQIFTRAEDMQDNPLAFSNAVRQSSAGITFTVRADAPYFDCKVSWAWYRHENTDGDTDKSAGWRREPQNWVRKFDIPVENYGSRYFSIKDDVWLHMHWLRKESAANDTIVTLTLINKNVIEEMDSHTSKEETIKKILFQVQLSVEGEEGTFVKIPTNGSISNDEETLEMQLLYHDYSCFGQGHGCSVEWDLDHGNTPHWICMAFIPEYNLCQMRPVIFKDNQTFNMKFLMEADSARIIDGLNDFLDRYGKWIEKSENGIFSLDKKLAKTAEGNIKKCSTALQRMRKSVKLLQSAAKASGEARATWRAFQLANQVMYMQRKQSGVKLYGTEIDDRDINWYPFQLAFFLHEIAGIIDPSDDTRDIVDLLWFPTGGGKTEAYLGIAAFTILLRRMRNRHDKTTAVFMRYTLRLLTLQQFERASMMIMACNDLNRQENISDGEIGIGLWVGNGLTPNKLADADGFLQKVKSDSFSRVSNQSGSPCLLKCCPWCGHLINETNYEVNETSRRLEVHCENPDCISQHFDHGVLPIHLVDEDIYAHKPTFIVSTVDKFAQLPKQDQAAALFDREHAAPNCPPELIIQDEMHLISGPLGSMVGLYETAVNALCTTDQGIGPKIIASTATVSNAAYQIKQLYGRNYSQFPPQCLTTDDSFFAFKSKMTEKPARLYCGVMSSSATLATTLIRVQAALFFATRSLLYRDQFERGVADNYWTMVCYFNSIRELGNSLTQLEDDVRGRFEYLRDMKFKHMQEMQDVEYPSYFAELTSRKGSDEVAEILSRLEYSITDENKADNVIDCVASSNMISVGVDVSRLGTMVVVGQPKTNSEYIQATSRVGRKNPGLVIALYNANRSRDRSHYEQFFKYHAGMYRYVEATSLTPFSDQAVLKGVHAVFVTLCRYLDLKLQPNDGAGMFRPDLPIVKRAKAIILARVRDVDPMAVDLVEERLDEFIDYWDHVKDTHSYTKKTPGDKYYLLQNDTSGEKFSTMNSMRTVDETSGVYVYNN